MPYFLKNFSIRIKRYAISILLIAIFPHEVIAAMNQAVVYIRVFPNIGAEPIEEGSGFIISKAGHIVTAKHVVKAAIEAGGRITVSLKYKSNNQVPASLFRCDKDGKYPDICILRINSDVIKGESLSEIPDLSCRTIEDQEELVAYGYASGEQNTLFAVPGKIIGGLGQFDLYPSTLPLTYGMSGGPVTDVNGTVIGVVAGGIKGGTHGYFSPLSQIASKILEATVPCTITSLESDRIAGTLSLAKIKTAEVQLRGVDDIMSVRINGALVEHANFGTATPWRNVKNLLQLGPNGILVEIWNGAYGSCGGTLEVKINGKVLPDISKSWYLGGEVAPYKGNCVTELLTLNIVN